MKRLLALGLLLPFAAHAVESAPVVTGHARATLVSEADSAAPGKPLRLALKLDMQKGWHSYWSNPGDAGAPTTIDITGATAGPIVFPTPQLLVEDPFVSFAYTGSVLLPFSVTPAAAAGLHVQAHASWLICERVCVPEEATLTLDLPAGSGAPGADAASFTAVDAATPRPSPFQAHVSNDGLLRLDAPGAAPVSAYFFPAEAGVIDQAAPQKLSHDAQGVSLKLKPLKPFDGKTPLAGVLTLTDQDGRMEALSLTAQPGAAAASAVAPGLARVLVLAFLGGLILNLMPCVLPVLAIKALAIARLSGAKQAHVRADAAWYTLGVVASFAAIGGITLAVSAAGGAGGWGVQFQSAGFTAAMALLMLAVALNFFGLFEIGASAAGIGQGLAARGSFFTGALAVVVATPCTAPFMATALAATLVLSPVQGMAVFLALGFGLASPYALLAAAPGMAKLLPRPGAWMDIFRRVLGLPMLGAAGWLGWVVLQQAGNTGLAALVAGAGFVTLAGWLYGRSQRAESSAMPAAGALAGVAGVLAALVLAAPEHTGVKLVAGSQPFSEARLQAARAAGQPALVDLSAAWCITCLVNERVALSPDAVQKAFTQKHVAYLVGDWTRRDPAITAYLKQFGRTGVPLYVYYPPHGEPQVLPQILTPGEILGRLNG